MALKYNWINKNKYSNTKTEIDGHMFDSRKEANRYLVLKEAERQGIISDLELQKAFVLIPTQRDAEGNIIEYSATYRADFCYYDDDGKFVVEDVKGYKTPEYILKKKLMLYIHGIRVKETR